MKKISKEGDTLEVSTLPREMPLPLCRKGRDY
jgi:hypothetical protein